MAQTLELPPVHSKVRVMQLIIQSSISNVIQLSLQEKPDSSTAGVTWKISPKQHFKYIVVLPTVFSAISCCTGLWFLLICLIPAINHAKKVSTVTGICKPCSI